jgi:flavodoxin
MTNVMIVYFSGAGHPHLMAEAVAGVTGQSEVDMTGALAILDEGDRLTSEHYGNRIATAAQRWGK